MAAVAEIEHVPAPWNLKGTAYILTYWSSTDAEGKLPSMAYSPLEYASPYASLENGRPLGGISMLQLIRYTESPVGPYDEFIISPGKHEYEVEENGATVKASHHRITRIYVSQKYTCWNGRTNWNIPKHLAKFDWTTTSNGEVSVKIYPHDTGDDPSEANPSEAPFFQATFKKVPLLPSFPLSLSILKYLGQDPKLVQPPLPQGNGSLSELPGTDQWSSVDPGQSSPKTSLGWFDIKQSEASSNENFWPGLGRWQLGFVMENSDINFPEGAHWDSPSSEK
ncbi:unnamed protein product [Clonostachys byssicola]|uniref:Acetoacetate decarboxylase n=1 Tax=Clonostachys byssicola TaxID=160290 RepID=A0A9N9XYZ6_9HYPO|nr:unnamed protein product [Clonostachys byssicola]